MNANARNLLACIVALGAAGLAGCGQAPSDGAADAPADRSASAPAPAKQRGYPDGMFEHPAAGGLRPAGQCALDRIDRQAVGAVPYTVGSELLFAGWFLPPKGTDTTQPLLVLSDGSRYFAHAFRTGGKRDDVATRLERPEAATSGYNARVTLAGLPAGDYSVWFVQEGEGAFRCDTRKTITVSN